MRSADRMVVVVIALVGVVAVFWFMAIAPKRQEAKSLDEDITRLEGSISQQQQVATFAEQARQDFPRYYERLVVLGKAVPEQADTASLLVQLDSVADRAGVEFRDISLNEGGVTAPAAPTAPATGTTPTDPSVPAPSAPADATGQPATVTTTDPTTGAPSDPAAVPAIATEASAAALPIGSAIGPAGLPALPYELDFRGRFFNISHFFGGMDNLVEAADQGVAANGRLVTIDGFALNPAAFPVLSANLAVTTYATPETQGLTGGATPTGPALSVDSSALPTPTPYGG